MQTTTSVSRVKISPTVLFVLVYVYTQGYADGTHSMANSIDPYSQPILYILVFILYVCLCAGPCLFESGLIPKRLSFREDAELLNYGIGVTNIVPRTTRAANELSKLV